MFLAKVIRGVPFEDGIEQNHNTEIKTMPLKSLWPYTTFSYSSQYSISLLSKQEEHRMTFSIIRDRTRKFRRKIRKFRKKIRKTIIFRGSREERFTRIYKHNYWGSIESRSGPGSEISYTENLRRELPKLIKFHGITQILDAPCGDFNWMQYVCTDTRAIKYIGGDIVKDLVARNNMVYGSEDIMFQYLDIIRDPLPKSDLMIVRDCLFHFSFKDIHRFLKNFHNSNISFLLTTTHRGIEEENYDIVTGDYRKIDLFSTPFCFPSNPIQRIKDYIPPHPPREVCLFTKDQVSIAYKTFSLNMKN